jgi:heterodisulfide reductase subunit B
MRYALFLGCTVPVRAQNYEASVRRIAPALGVELVDFPAMGCCGYPVQSLSRDTALAMSSRSLAQAGEAGLDVCALCSACSASLKAAARELEDGALRERINAIAGPDAPQYRGGVKVRHIAEILAVDVGIGAVRDAVRRPLAGVRIAVHYGCHYLRPHEVHGGFDDHEDPRTIDDLVAATGAASVDYPGRLRCCGGGILGIDERTALGITRCKLDAAASSGADAMTVVCPFCSVMMEGNQKRVEKAAGTGYNLPVVYYPQLLGLAMGFEPGELGFQLNRIKADGIVARAVAP